MRIKAMPAELNAAIEMSGRALAAGTPRHLVSCEKDDKLEVFLLPGLSGDLREFAALLSPTEAPVRFVPIRYRHWSKLQRGPNELDRLVTDCVRQIESHSSSATIRLVGYSFGGLMAWAVARAMAASGRRIGLLGLIDAYACPEIEESAESIIGRMGRVIRGVRRGETGEQLARSCAGVLFRSRTWVRAAFRRLHGFGLLSRIFDRIDGNIQNRYHIIVLKECIARMVSFPNRIGCPSVLFRCSDQPFGENAELGWTPFLSNLRVVTLSGDHSSVMQAQNAKQIITQLTVTISQGEGAMPRSTGQLHVNQIGCPLSTGHAARTRA
jgi:thioesterase domain-containing protein